MAIDIDSIATKGAANEGAWLNLKHPETDELLTYEDEKGVERNARVKVRGLESDKIKRKRIDIERTNASGSRKVITETEMGDILIRALIMEIDGFSKDGKPLNARIAEDIELFLSISNSFWEQIFEFCSERSNFLAKTG